MQVESIYAMDFFTVDTFLNQRFYVLFIPNMNAIAERFVGSARRDALDYFLLFNEKQIRNILKNYICYYNNLRPHQGIDQQVPKGYLAQKKRDIRSKPILEGLHHHYFREVA